jgi:coilin
VEITRLFIWWCEWQPVFHFSNDIRNKRQGQGWGQEKQSDKYVDKKKTFVENPQQGSEPNIHPSKQRSFEGFPLLDGAPQIGDILAYRLVELTHSWTPEISPYRVGKVSGFEGSLGNLMLVPVAEYPLHEYSEDEGEEFAQQEDIHLPPYNPDGSLEVVSLFLFLLLSFSCFFP